MEVSDSDSSNDNSEIVPEAIREAAKNVTLDLLPDRSKRLYTIAYNTFKKWRREQKSNSFCEDVLLAYFADLSKKYAPSSLWATYSMLKSTINSFDHVDISTYNRLISFLKKKSKGHVQKKSAVFTKDNISKFLNEAPDEIYLCEKVTLIIGIAGTLRRVEFVNLTINDIQHFEDTLLFKILKTKNFVPRSFTITGPLYNICKQYMELRPASYTTDRFFLRYTKGHCCNQPIGINTFASMPKTIAKYLNLPEVNSYTGHSFRRTSATLLIDAGADLTTLQRHGGWKSRSVAYGYIADSINNKKKIYQQISSEIKINTTRNIPVISEVVDTPMSSYTATNKQYRLPLADQTNKVHPKASTNKNSSMHTVSSPLDTHQVQPEDSNTDKISMDVSMDRVLSPVKTHRVEQQTTAKGTTQTAQMESGVPRSILYDPDIGLYLFDFPDEKSNKILTFNNCNVTISGSNSSFRFHASEVKNKATQID